MWDFVEHEVTATEQKWKDTEDQIPALYGALTDRTLLKRPEFLQAAKEVIALHVVRSLTRRSVHEIAVPRARDDLLRALRRNPNALALGFLTCVLT